MLLRGKIIRKQYSARTNTTAIEFVANGETQVTHARGNVESSTARYVSAIQEKSGSTFIAQSDSKTMQTEGKDKGKPIYLKGEVVKRLKDSNTFKSMDGEGAASEFVVAAAMEGLVLNYVSQ